MIIWLKFFSAKKLYSFIFKQKFLIKASGSKLGSALVDFILFPTIAFGVVKPHIVLRQFPGKDFEAIVLVGCIGAVAS